MNKTRELPQYMQVYEMLRRNISEGVYTPGMLLPSERELCSLCDVARPTARRALAKLVEDGLIIKHQGKGSIVKGIPKEIGILSVTGTTTALGGVNFKTHIITEPEIREWSEAFTFQLTDQEISKGCVYFERLRILGNKPIFFEITMLPNDNLPNIVNYDLENRSLFDFLRSTYQIEVTGGDQQLFAVRADRRLCEYLEVRAGSPILQLNRKIETTRKDFYIYSQVFCATKGFGLTGTF